MISCLVLFHTKYMTASLRPYLLGQLQAFEHSKHDSPFNWICCYRRHQRHTIHSPDYSSTQQILTSRDSFLYRHHLPNHEYKFPPLNANYAVACCCSPAATICALTKSNQPTKQEKKREQNKTHPDHPRKKHNLLPSPPARRVAVNAEERAHPSNHHRSYPNVLNFALPIILSIRSVNSRARSSQSSHASCASRCPGVMSCQRTQGSACCWGGGGGACCSSLAS